MDKYATLIITQYITHLSFHLKVLVKPELSMHGPMGHQNISFVY